MGDPLTLETAEERELWRSVFAHAATSLEAYLSTCEESADAAVRAYRERLPASDDGPATCAMTPREVEYGSGKLRITVDVDGAEGDVYLSRDMWAHYGERAGWETEARASYFRACEVVENTERERHDVQARLDALVEAVEALMAVWDEDTTLLESEEDLADAIKWVRAALDAAKGPG